MAIQFPISPFHGQQFTPSGIPVTWQYDIGRTAWRVVRGGPSWTEIVGKPLEFPPSPHGHEIDDILNLQDILNVKQDISARGQPSGYPELDPFGKVPRQQLPDGLGIDWDDIGLKPDTFPPSPHTHPVVEISDSSSVGQQVVRAPTPFAARSAIGAITNDDNARVSIKNSGTVIGIRRGINFMAGTNTTLLITDDVANEEVDVTINATGGGGGASLLVTEVKPASPADSTLWLDVGTGLLFTYYNDGVRKQWIEAIPYLTSMPAAFTKFMFPAAPINDQLYNPIPGATWKWSTTRGVWFAAAAASTSYTKAESDANFVDVVGDVMTGALTLYGDPTAPLQAATKQYVDGKASVYISDTPPTGAPVNSLWWESDSGLLYVRYNDGTSTQWVIASPQPDFSTLAPLASPALTGNPTAPTQSPGDNDTSIATTAFVSAAVTAGIATVPPGPVAATAPEFVNNSAPTKMLTSGAVWGAAANVITLSETDGAATPDLASGFDFYWPLSAAGRTLNNPTNIKVGQKGTITSAPGAAGTITSWGSFYKFPGSLKPVLTLSGMDALSYFVVNSTTILCSFSASFG